MVFARSGDLMKPLLDQGGVAPNGRPSPGHTFPRRIAFCSRRRLAGSDRYVTSSDINVSNDSGDADEN